jgi:hypothetical protein
MFPDVPTPDVPKKKLFSIISEDAPVKTQLAALSD